MSVSALRLERVFEFFGRAEADGLRRLELHDFVRLRVANLAGLAGPNAPRAEAGVREAGLGPHRLADVVEDDFDDLGCRLLGQPGLLRDGLDELVKRYGAASV